MRSLLLASATTLASIAFQIGLATGHFRSYEWVVPYLYIAAGAAWVFWLISHPKIRKKLFGELTSRPESTAPPSPQTRNAQTMSGNVVNVNPQITVSPIINQHATQQPVPVEPARPKPPEPNLVLGEVRLGTLYLVGDIWSKNVPPGLTQQIPKYQAIFAEIKNASKQGELAGPASKIRAELVISSNGRHEELAPLPWLDAYYNTVNFQFGDVKHVLLAVAFGTSMPQVGDWRVVLNSRDDQALGDRVSAMDFDRSLKRVPQAEVRLNLLHITGGRILQSFEGVCRWKDGYGIPDILFKQPK